MAKQQKPAKKPVETGVNTNRRNGKAWKRRVCGDRHSEVNCSKCSKVYVARHDAEVIKRRAERAAKAATTA